MNFLKRAIAAAAPAAALLAGCLSVGPDFERPEIADPAAPLPDAGLPTHEFTEGGEIAPAQGEADNRHIITSDTLSVWWRSFNDPILAELVDIALTNNISLNIARERLEQARWQLLGSAAPLFPHVSLGAAASANEYGTTTTTGASAGGRHLHRDHFQGGFDASWEIDIFGGERRSIESAIASVSAAGAGMQATWVSITAEIGVQYANLRTVQQRLKVARENLKLQSETYALLAERYDSGIGDKLAVNQSKYILEQTRAQIPALLTEEEALVNALEILVGVMPGTLHDTLLQAPGEEWKVEPYRLASISLDALRGRPDVMEAEYRLHAAVAAVGVAKSMYYPKLYINGTLGLESASFSDVFKRSSLVASIGPSVSWPLFQGGNIHANVRVQESKVNEATLAYELAVRTAYAEARNAYSAYTRQYHRNQSLEAAVAAAREAAGIAQDLYTNGLADFNNVLDAQRSQLALEEALAVSRGQIAANLISLYKALGGGLAREENNSEKPLAPPEK